MLLIKVFVAYDSKYGNTKLAAENVLAGIKEAGVIETGMGYVKEIEVGSLICYDAIVLGGPNHMGRPSRVMKKFVDRMAAFDLKAKQVAIFGTYSGKIRAEDRAVKKMEKAIREKMPSLTLIKPTLSIRVRGVSGPVMEGELSRCVDFGRKLADQLKS
jgi:flavorubredoxin